MEIIVRCHGGQRLSHSIVQITECLAVAGSGQVHCKTFEIGERAVGQSSVVSGAQSHAGRLVFDWYITLYVIFSSSAFSPAAKCACLLGELAKRRQVPTVADSAILARNGVLLSYGADQNRNFAREAEYVDKILHGAKPADLPVEQPTKFELVINLRTAKALGLNVPPSLLARADEVIE